MKHTIERTSPTGPGQKFVGYCPHCGKTGLTFADMDEDCPNPAGLTEDEALVAAIEGPEGSEDAPPMVGITPWM